jgi:uncharacterized membrane protein YphA (DoxX/SURF4 family)
MTNPTTDTSDPKPRPPRFTFPRVLLGGLLLVELLLMGLAGITKFTNPEVWAANFTSLGYPNALAPLIGALEVLGVVLLLVPRLTSYAALALGIIMLAALQAVLTHPNDLGATAPVIHLVLLVAIARMRWGRRWRRL